MSFQDKVVIVTGASSGIGAATAIKFAEEGAKVALVGRNQEKLNNVAKKCGNPVIIIADVSKDDDAKRVIEDTLRYLGKIDILVNNAGIATPVSILSEHAIKIFDQVMSTNLHGPVYLTHLAAPHLVKTKGNIVNVSSVASSVILAKDFFAYSASKAALDHFSRAVALELATSGVRVNVVNPGPVRTDIVENMGATKEVADATYSQMHNITPLNRISEPEEVADLIMYLASDKAQAMTGTTVVTDNGMILKSNIVPPQE
ncbi:uncharacterized protein LOC111362107 [Spodoptera litura]|uniref:Uncharacterized protein LOC111362107 n=1 Tax=Spodoptera litura TaxID=69820 RepID=A0A9J7EN10_SPOLT|nr:uncharacterized protein LOC111362107 [Spodoptera litura]